METRIVLTMLLATGLGSSVASANTEIAVPADHPTVAAALAAAAPGDLITIAAGTHVEHDIDPQGKAVTIQGVIASDGTLATTLDAQGNGSGFLLQTNETNDTIIRYLRITGGSGHLTSPIRSGGGFFIDEASPTILGCEIVGNSATDLGGGIAAVGSHPRIIDCTISGNTSETGGGIYLNRSTVFLGSTTICGNSSDQQYLYESTISGGNNTIADNCPGRPGDLNGDGVVDQTDLDLVRLEAGLCNHDVDGDGRTDIEDLLILLAGYGTICP